MSKKLTSSMLVRVLIVVVTIIVALLSMTTMLQSTAGMSPTATRVYGSYRPEDHGIPDQIGAYRVLGVMTHENTACMSADVKQVVLQGMESSAQDFLASDMDVQMVQRELERIEPTVHWIIVVVGPNATAEQVAVGNPEWNAAFADGNCIRLGPMEEPLTPNR